MIFRPCLVPRDTDPTASPDHGMRAGRWCIALAAASLALFGLDGPARAAQPAVPLLADSELGGALLQATRSLGPGMQRMEVRSSAGSAACVGTAGTAPRLALLARTPPRSVIDQCGRTASGKVSIVEIGRHAVALVVPINSPVWSVSAAGLFRALGLNSGEAARTTNWKDVDPSYPALPIGFLAPAANSRTRQLFDALIMQPGCDQVSTRTPFDLKNRAAFCSALRTDIQISERDDSNVQGVANWAAAALPGQIAVVSVAELQQLGHRVVPLLLDNTLPTTTNIESARYPAAKIELMIVMPDGANRNQRADARKLAFDLLAETSIGPTGSLASAGLLPLPPPERIAARSQAVAFMEQP
jgi:phosphate transport system substrate-binding protein